MKINSNPTQLQVYFNFMNLTRQMREKSCSIYKNWDNNSYVYLKNQLRDNYETLKKYWEIITDENMDSRNNLIRHISFGDSQHGGTHDYWDILSNDLKELEIILEDKIIAYAKTNNYLIYNKPKYLSVSDEIIAISPSFHQIYKQAEIADSVGLDQISGLGYRKSLEYLIKDFCIHYNKDKSESIKKAMLAQVISNYIGDTNIKDCAERAAWLGNDETHYEKRWLDKDINDLKKLICLTMKWMEIFISTCDYRKSMPKKS